ncbi:hypothetical protein V8B97DRAFT_2104210 [Scleroderma yunnanense]
MPTRFHYTQTVPEDFALTPAEILLATDAELNAYVGLKKIAPYRLSGKGKSWDSKRNERLKEFREKLRARIGGGEGDWVIGGSSDRRRADGGSEGGEKKKRLGKKERAKMKASGEENKEVGESMQKDTKKRKRDSHPAGDQDVEVPTATVKKKRRRQHKKGARIDSIAVHSRAARAEHASDFSTAFRLYISAADAFLHLSRSESLNSAFQARCKANAAKALERAEKIKKASERPGAGFEVDVVPIDWFSQEQQLYVVRKSSTINGIRYPIWTDAVSICVPNTLYIDPDGQPSVPHYAVSPNNDGSHLPSWNRLVQPLHSPSRTPFTSLSTSLEQAKLSPTDIEQHFINDCSVCALISVCAQHATAFKSKLLVSSIFPGQQPGRYDLKVLINGIHRRVTIDDTLPFDSSGHPIGITTGTKRVVWPALIEKGYMKLMGGYDFPGSNSAIDLHALTGWIPELIDLHKYVASPVPTSFTSFERERTWSRLMSGFRNGHCVLTVGTDSKTARKIKGMKLLPSHNYAVIGTVSSIFNYGHTDLFTDVREDAGERWMSLLDSRIPVATSPTPNRDGLRTLDMRWDDLCATFEGIYASWDPRLFHQELGFQGMWKPGNADDKEQSSIRHLRLLYTYTPNTSSSTSQSLISDNEVWVLLVRHLPDTRRTGEYITATVNAEDEWMNAGTVPSGRAPSLGVPKTEAEVKGIYTTSTHVLVRTKAPIDVASRGLSRSPTPSLLSPSPTLRPTTPIPSSLSLSPSTINVAPLSGALTILSCYDGPFDDVCFSVSVFCGSGLMVNWDENAGVGGIGVKGHSMKVDGNLTIKNAGGNHTYPTYMLNPQWHLRILEQEPIRRSVSPAIGAKGPVTWQGPSTSSKDKAAVILSAMGPREVPLNLTAVWSAGERVVELAQREVVASSGAYAYGYARAFANLSSGDYTMILSAFEPQIHLGAFTVKVESSRKFELTPIPQEGAGMYMRVTKGEWWVFLDICPLCAESLILPRDARTAVGGPSHGRYHLNPIYEVDIPSMTQLGARLHLTSGSQSVSLNLSLFPAIELALFDRPLASSGPYSDALAGVDIPTRTLAAGKYWLVPSTWTAGFQAGFKLIVYCSESGCVVNRKDT